MVGHFCFAVLMQLYFENIDGNHPFIKVREKSRLLFVFLNTTRLIMAIYEENLFAGAATIMHFLSFVQLYGFQPLRRRRLQSEGLAVQQL